MSTKILSVVFAWVWNLVFHIKGVTLYEDVWEQGAGENIWAREGQNGGCILRNAIVHGYQLILLVCSKQGGWEEWGI